MLQFFKKENILKVSEHFDKRISRFPQDTFIWLKVQDLVLAFLKYIDKNIFVQGDHNLQLPFISDLRKM